MYDVITIGSALVDIFIRSHTFQLRPEGEGLLLCQPYGDKVEIDSLDVLTGGGGGNTGVGFARLGFNTATVTETGRDPLAQVILDEFHAEYVTTNFIVQEKKEQTGGSVILVGNDGGRTIFVHRGASSMLDPHDIPVKMLERAEWVHLSSISGRREALATVADALMKGDTRMSWNPGKRELELLASKQVTITDFPCKIFIVNRQEWESVASVHQEIRTHVPLIVVTNGKKGGLLIQHDKDEYHFEASGVEPVDETGAGDAFSVGFVGAFLLGRDSHTACAWGVKNAASVVTHLGGKAGLLKREHFDEVESMS